MTPEQYALLGDVLVKVLAALTGLLGVLLGSRKIKQYRESLRPKRRREDETSMEPGPYRPDPVDEEAPTLKPPKRK